jgi:hypothetical protein
MIPRNQLQTAVFSEASPSRPATLADSGQVPAARAAIARTWQTLQEAARAGGGAAAVPSDMTDSVDHPPHYGGAGNAYEAIKVVEAWGLDFHLGNVVKYISRAGKKGDILEDLKKARWYLDRKIANLEKAKAK